VNKPLDDTWLLILLQAIEEVERVGAYIAEEFHAKLG